jgi:hypothetical protein
MYSNKYFEKSIYNHIYILELDFNWRKKNYVRTKEKNFWENGSC